MAERTVKGKLDNIPRKNTGTFRPFDPKKADSQKSVKSDQEGSQKLAESTKNPKRYDSEAHSSTNGNDKVSKQLKIVSKLKIKSRSNARNTERRASKENDDTVKLPSTGSYEGS